MRVRIVVTQFDDDAVELGIVEADEQERVPREDIANLIINHDEFWTPGTVMELRYDVGEE